MIEKKAIPVDKYVGELSRESVYSDIKGHDQNIPVYGDYSTIVAAKLNEVFAKHNDENSDEKVEYMGRDFDGNSEDFDYRIGRQDVISGIEGSHDTMNDTKLSIEHVGTEGIGMYNIVNEVAGIAAGVPNTNIWTLDYRSLNDEFVDRIRDLIMGGTHVILILFIPTGTQVSDVSIDAPKLYDLMEQTNHLTVFMSYQLTR